MGRSDATSSILPSYIHSNVLETKFDTWGLESYTILLEYFAEAMNFA